MTVNADRAFHALLDLADNVARTPDIPSRLNTLVRINSEWERLIVPLRDQTAYELRLRYALADAAQLTGHSPTSITYWMMQHRNRTGAAKIGRHERIDLDGAIDLSQPTVVIE